jgi:metal-dependent amidase/aminoacylase/carboxypeptidase family protein
VIGLLVGGKPGPVVAYRADMDAVNSDAPDPVPYRSQIPGVRHICGHDVHTTVAVGIAEALASLREELPGTVKFIFQPSEENAQGAKAMIDDGVLENPAPAAIYALHSAPFELGQFGTTEGMLLAGLDMMSVTLSGKGDLKAAAGVSAKVISDVSTVGPMDAPPGAVEASTENTVRNDFILATVYDREENPEIPQMILRVMIRASSEKNSEKARQDIQSGLDKLDMADITHKVEFNRGVVPAVINDTVLARKAMETIQKLRGEEGLIVIEETTPFFSEDFAFFLQRIPGVMFFLGVSNTKKGIVGMPHTPQFAVDEEAIIIGAKTMAAVLWDYLVTNHP